ncbi:DUF1616 domain-containing protein [Haloprofundus halobius]|uniref:DUF1616 domain-containing protein n=1 Tax=Haloprofundus halobius TaxID=2876194 RepID=UPI001CC93B88|nr:DUF1616 domain-containing protein [Haloprofundus halobius]
MSGRISALLNRVSGGDSDADRRLDVSRLRSWFGVVVRSVSIANVVLAAAVVFSVGAVAYSVGAGGESSQHTELYVLGENEDGTADASTYPDELVVGEPTRLTAAVDNHERTAQSYTLVVQLDRVNPDAESESGPVVTATQRVGTYERTVGAGETWRISNRIVADESVVGDRVRLTYLLYRGEPPREPTVENAYRTVHIWVSVDDTAS